MVTRKRTGRKRGTTKKSGRKRSAKSARRATQQAGEGRNFRRRVEAGVLRSSGATRATLAGIERLTGPQVTALIAVRRRVGRNPNWWLI